MRTRRPAPQPTPEQEAAVAAFTAGEHIVLQAGAGSGKTTTLAMLAASTRRWGRYLAFNAAIAHEAQRSFPSNVGCRTAHSMAFRAVGWRYDDRLRAPRMSSAKLAAMLGINMELQLGLRRITATGLAYAAQETVIRYCQSADAVLGAQHVPLLKGIGEQCLHDQLVEVVLPYAHRMWVDLHNPDHGRVKFRHDHYLKMWALTEPVIRGQFLLLDEAQDTNPVVERVFTAQRGHAQLVMVGDSGQAIYGWRGARDVMTGFDGTQLTLSHSFRFGERIAQEANRWLAIAQAPIRIVGSPTLDSGLDTVKRPDAILCRTNGGVMAEIVTLLDLGRRVALVGRGDTLAGLALAARDLKSGRRTSHPELLLFSTWGEVQDYAEHDPDGRDLQPFVDVIDEHGVDIVLDVISRLCDEAGADVTVSTVHKAKGRDGPPCASPATSSNLKTPPKKSMPPASRFPDRLIPPRPGSPTSRSPAPVTDSTSVDCPGSTATPTETPNNLRSQPTAEQRHPTRHGLSTIEAPVSAAEPNLGCRRGLLRAGWW